MNIIEAIQAAENGALIRNDLRKLRGHVLKYMGSGVFFEYEIIKKKPSFKYEVRDFSMMEVISISWEIVEERYFPISFYHE